MRGGGITQDGVLCLDFGTAFAKAAYCHFDDSAHAHPIALEIGSQGHADNKFLIPSEVFIGNETLYIGARARQQLLEEDFGMRESLRSFKTILSARDLEAILESKLPPKYDPGRTLTYRAVFVLNLAYLLSLARQSIRQLYPDAYERIREFRYVFPHWVESEHDTRLRLISELFVAAFAISDQEDEDILNGALPIERVPEMLATGPGSPHLEQSRAVGAVFEPAAALFAYFPDGIPEGVDAVVSLDIGAGTTDLAGFRIDHPSSSFELIPGTCRSISVAGDALDAAVINMIVEDSRLSLTPARKKVAWKRLSAIVRELKKTLLADTFLELRFGRQDVRFKSDDLYDQVDFKSAVSEMKTAVWSVLDRIRAETRTAKHISVFVAGGGANYPFLNDLVLKTMHAGKPHAVERLRHEFPAWGNAGSEDMFLQLSTAVGGAGVGPKLVTRFHGSPV